MSSNDHYEQLFIVQQGSEEAGTMVGLALFGIATVAMADFDLAASSSTKTYASTARFLPDPLRTRSPYLPPKLEDQSTTDAGGVRVKLKWRRVKVTVPFS